MWCVDQATARGSPTTTPSTIPCAPPLPPLPYAPSSRQPCPDRSQRAGPLRQAVAGLRVRRRHAGCRDTADDESELGQRFSRADQPRPHDDEEQRRRRRAAAARAPSFAHTAAAAHLPPARTLKTLRQTPLTERSPSCLARRDLGFDCEDVTGEANILESYDDFRGPISMARMTMGQRARL